MPRPPLDAVPLDAGDRQRLFNAQRTDDDGI